MIDPAIYKQVMGAFPSGVTVVTTLDAEGNLAGLTASAFSALSLDPALVLFCPNYSSDTYPLLRDGKGFAIHLLSAEQQRIAYAFASKGKDKTQGYRMDAQRPGQSAAGGRHRGDRVRAVARVRRRRPRHHRRGGEESHRAGPGGDPDALSPGPDGRRTDLCLSGRAHERLQGAC